VSCEGKRARETEPERGSEPADPAAGRSAAPHPRVHASVGVTDEFWAKDKRISTKPINRTQLCLGRSPSRSIPALTHSR